MCSAQQQTDITSSVDIALIGNCGYKIENDRVIVDVAKIANQRSVGDLSGTLAIELWALKQAYDGTDFSGVPLAATTIGEIAGQHYIDNCRYDLVFQEPEKGSWQLTLMLREWTETGYVTRDYVNFALPYLVAATPAVTRDSSANVINVRFSDSRKSATAAAAENPAPIDAEAAMISDQPATSPEELPANSGGNQDPPSAEEVRRNKAEDIARQQPDASGNELPDSNDIGQTWLQKLRRLFSL